MNIKNIENTKHISSYIKLCLLAMTVILGLLVLFVNAPAKEALASEVSTVGVTAASSETVAFPPDPVKEGYTFKGWYLDAEFEEPYEGQAITGNISLYAKFEINTYKVTFETNGGTTIAQQTVNYNLTATRPVEPTKTGCTFVNWYSDVACTQVYDFATQIKANTTIYAKWETATCTITFETNGGTTVASQIVDYNLTATEPAEPTKEGHNFINWYSDEACTQVYDFATQVKGNITIYAKWEVQKFTVTFYVDGEVYTTVEVDYGTVFGDIATPFGLVNFKFLGSEPITGNIEVEAETDFWGDALLWVIDNKVGIAISIGALALIIIVIVVIKKKRG